MGGAIVYLRVSTREQADSGLGLEAQRAACRAWCEREGVEPAAEFADAGVSGGTAPADRPGLVAAIEALGSGGVLLAARRDRLARDMGVMGMLERVCERRGARLASAAGEGTDQGDPIAAFLHSRLVDLFAEYERLLASTRTKAALGAKRARGERVGSIPYGKRLAACGVRLETDEREAEIVAAVADLRARGLSLRAVAAELERRGYANRAGRAFNHKTIGSIERLALRSAGSIEGGSTPPKKVTLES